MQPGNPVTIPIYSEQKKKIQYTRYDTGNVTLRRISNGIVRATSSPPAHKHWQTVNQRISRSIHPRNTSRTAAYPYPYSPVLLLNSRAVVYIYIYIYVYARPAEYCDLVTHGHAHVDPRRVVYIYIYVRTCIVHNVMVREELHFVSPNGANSARLYDDYTRA